MKPATFVFICLLARSALASQDGGTTSAEFLKFGVGARYLGMAGAAVSTVDDPAAAYWNPANLSLLTCNHLTMMSAETLDAGRYHFAGFGKPVGRWGGLAGTLQMATVNTIGMTDESGRPLGDLSPRDTAATLGWGRRFGPSLALGLSGDYVQSKIVHTATAFSLGAGGAYEWRNWRLGVGGRHLVASQLQYDQEKSSLPRSLQIGASYRFKERWLFALDTNDTRGSPWVVMGGVEYGQPLGDKQTLFLRSGYQTRPADLPGTQGLSLGLGWRWKGVDVDYALLPMGDVEGAQTHRFSLGVRFGEACARPADSDHDAVIDKEDLCPETPLGTTVDSTGCPPDTDGDGVNDLTDICPQTPAKAPVDAVGCPLDSDKDGVSDYVDQCPGTPFGLPVEPTGCLKEIVKQLPKQAHFGFDHTGVDPALKPWLNRFSNLMQEHPSLDALIEGHSDSAGSAAYNQQLSERRARAVQDYLMESGQLPDDRFVVIGYGENRPLLSNETAEGRAQNRRVDITLILRRPMTDAPSVPPATP